MKAKLFLLGLLTITFLLVACVPLENPPEDNTLNSSYPLFKAETSLENPEDSVNSNQELLPETTQFGDLTMEVYQLKIWKPGMEEGTFDTTIGSSEEILKRRDAWREELRLEDEPFLNGEELHVFEQFEGSKAMVIVQLAGKEVLTIDCGEISPINNLRGKWVSGDDWYVEIAHVETESEEQFSKGDIYKNGKSLNEEEGYDESFDFQILNGKPFYFFSKDGKIGFSYAGSETKLDFDDVSHHLCCSAAANNPRHYPRMVSFNAWKSDDNFYIELGVFD